MKNSTNGHHAQTDHSSNSQSSSATPGAFRALMPELQRAVATARYDTPTPIQEQCIPPLLERRDLLGSAQTGTGKTAAFCLPLLQRLAAHKQRPQRNHPRALILAPTRELAAQVGDSIKTYGRYLNLSHAVIYGGVKQTGQVKALNRGVDIVVATPGRLLDLMNQKHIKLSEIEVFILDEVDRMLDMGFIPDIKRVLAKVPEQRQNLFFSATMPPKLEELAKTMVKNPVRIALSHKKPAVECIDQNVVFVGAKNKKALLVDILRDNAVSKALIFTQMKHAANKLVDKLSKAGIRGAAIHGNKSQGARTRALDGFKRGKYQILVATDVAARGLDVDDISHVINYDMPVEAETYVHRIGRTGRAGADGTAISFCSAEDRAYLRDIERLLGKPVPADTQNPYHCEEARQSRAPKAGRGSRKGGGRYRGGQARSRSRR
ncbi:MAG: DEAD/DEAH box helicase [Lentisphaeria bacterium]